MNAAGKAWQRWKITAVIKFTKPGKSLLAEPGPVDEPSLREDVCLLSLQTWVAMTDLNVLSMLHYLCQVKLTTGIQSQPNPGLRSLGTPCTWTYEQKRDLLSTIVLSSFEIDHHKSPPFLVTEKVVYSLGRI